MPEPDAPLATQAPLEPDAPPVIPEDTPPPAPDPDAPPTPESYFLEADDRHRYRTKDDAARAIRESGETIGRLTPWQEHARRYGVDDPNALPQIFDNYLAMQQRLQTLEAQIAANDRGREPAPTALSPQDKANVEYLKARGFTQQDAIDKVLNEKLSPLEQQVRFLSSQLGETQAMQQNAAIDSGREHLATLMTDAGLPVDNAQFNAVVENSIIAWMEEKTQFDNNGQPVRGSVLDRFYQGGAASRAIVAEGFKLFTDSVNVLRQHADGQYQARKNANVSRTPRPLPKQGGPVPAAPDTPGTPVKRAPGAGGIFTDPALHDRAWELLQDTQRQR